MIRGFLFGRQVVEYSAYISVAITFPQTSKKNQRTLPKAPSEYHSKFILIISRQATTRNYDMIFFIIDNVNFFPAMKIDGIHAVKIIDGHSILFV